METRENSIVFKPGKIGNIELKNRLVRSATFESAASGNGEVTEDLVGIHRVLAEGGVGLIITGIMGVAEKAITPGQARIDDDSFINGLKKIPEAVRRVGNDCKIIVQLNHPGRQIPDPEKRELFIKYLPPAWIKLMSEQPPAGETSQEPHPEIEPVAPSPIFDELLQRIPRALSLEEVEELIDSFAAGIRRVQESGFDGVQLHAAHGWFLSSFLSPHTNHRQDKYGGSTENRVRIVTEIYERARKLVGDDFPILIKMNTTDFFPDGTDLEEAVKVSKLLSKTGFAALKLDTVKSRFLNTPYPSRNQESGRAGLAPLYNSRVTYKPQDR